MGERIRGQICAKEEPPERVYNKISAAENLFSGRNGEKWVEKNVSGRRFFKPPPAMILYSKI